jgi:hypothetical protein
MIMKQFHIPHILVASLLIAFFFMAESVYAKLILKNGHPATSQVSIPDQSLHLTAAFNSLSPARYEGQEMYFFEGFIAFEERGLLDPLVLSIVLHSDAHKYAFHIDRIRTLTLPDGRSGTEIRAILGREVIAQGIYQTGLLFENQQTGDRFFHPLDEYIEKTANFLIRYPSRAHLGLAVISNPNLPEATDGLHYHIDSYDKLQFDKKLLFQISGWSLAKQKGTYVDPGRFLILKSDRNLYRLSTEVQARPDVAEVFAEFEPGIYTGFTIFIDTDKIQRGVYQVGILMTEDGEGSILTYSDLYVQVLENEVLFEDRSSTKP